MDNIANHCIFCKIRDGSIPAPKLDENDLAFVITDIQPQASVHLLVIPKKHVTSLNDLSEADRTHLLPALYSLADKVSQQKGFRENGYRTVINNQTLAGQTVFHLHMHVLGGGKLKGSFGS